MDLKRLFRPPQRPKAAWPSMSAAGTYRLGAQFTPGVKLVLGLYALTCVLGNLPAPIGSFVQDHFLLRPGLALGRMPWQLLTGPLVHVTPSPLWMNVLQLLFTALVLWSIGSAVEQRLGTRRFLYFAGSAGVLAALAAAAVGRLVPGLAAVPVYLDSSPLFMALLSAFAGLFAEQRVSFFGIGEPVSGRGLSYFLIGISLLSALLRSAWPDLAASAAAAYFGLAFVRRDGGGLLQGARRLYQRLRLRWLRQRYKVIDGGLPGSPPRRERPEPKRWVN